MQNNEQYGCADTSHPSIRSTVARHLSMHTHRNELAFLTSRTRVRALRKLKPIRGALLMNVIWSLPAHPDSYLSASRNPLIKLLDKPTCNSHSYKA